MMRSSGLAGGFIKRNLYALMAVGLFLAISSAVLTPLIISNKASAAPSTYYVRDDGSDTNCDGTANKKDTVANEPGCAFATISQAVSTAVSGDKIKVRAGTYNEVVNVNKALDISGAQTTDGASHSGAESTVTEFNITSSDVTINGFELNNSNGIQVNISSGSILSGITIKNSVFSDYGTVGMPTNNAGDLTIKNNYFTSPATSGEAMQIKANLSGGCSGTQVKNNVFDAATNNGSADVNFSCTGSGSTNVEVSGNVDTNNSGGTSFAAFAGISGGLSVTGNTVTGSTGSAIFFWGGVTGSVDISDNTITGGASNAISVNNILDGDNTGDFSITNNDLSGNNRALNLSDAFTSAASVTMNENDLSGNTTAAINNDSADLSIVDATKNWWGSAVASTIESEITGSNSANVSYNPYYVDSARTTLNTTEPATVYVDGSYSDGSAGGHIFGYDAFTTIQDGINAVASNGTVNVAEGTYNENVNLNKVATLKGSGKGSNPASNTVISGSGSGTGVNISAGADASNRATLQAVHVTGFTTGVVASSYNTVKNIRSNENGSYGIALNNLQDLVIKNSSFNKNNVGMKIGSTVSVDNVSITGSQFDKNTAAGWYSDKNSASGSYITNLSVTDTTFNDNTNKGFYTEKLSDAVFDGITVDNSGTGGATNHRAGMDINLKYGDYENIQILNSTITNNGTGDDNGGGILIKARSTGSYAGNPATLDNVLLNNVVVTGNGGGTYAAGVRIGESNNSFTGIDAGPTNVVISNSTLTGNSAHDVRNATDGTTVDASKNWWGSTANPSTQVSGDVVYAPWCEQEACTSYISDEAVKLDASGGSATVTDGDLTLKGTTSGKTVTAVIPEGTTITGSGGPGTWDGTINPPETKSVTIPGTSGYTTHPAIGISIGSDDYKLTFDMAVRLLLEGQAGKKIGFIQPGGSFKKIKTACDDDTQGAANAQLLPSGECKINSGSNLVVWTTHFTDFATYTLTAVPSGGGSGGGSGGSGGGESASTPINVSTFSSAASAGFAASDQLLGGSNSSDGNNDGTNDENGNVRSDEAGISTATSDENEESKSYAWLWWLVAIAAALVIVYAVYKRKQQEEL